MKANGIKLESRGMEHVAMWDGSIIRKTVWVVPGEWKFFIKFDGEMHEVFHRSCWFSVKKPDDER